MKTLKTLALLAATMLLAGSFTESAEAGQRHHSPRYSAPRHSYHVPTYDWYHAPHYRYSEPPRYSAPNAGGYGDEGIQDGGGDETGGGFADDEGAGEESDLSALEGLWEAVSTDRNGQRQQIRMNVRADATAELTVPTGRGGFQTIIASISVTSGQLVLDSDGRIISLGQVVTATSTLVVLKNDRGNIVFRRP